jgi:hypothetical protein
MTKNKKKKPSEYPLFAFRIDEEKKEALNSLIEETRETLNKKLSPDDKLWMKNDIIYQALLLGLPLLKKQNK